MASRCAAATGSAAAAAPPSFAAARRGRPEIDGRTRRGIVTQEQLVVADLDEVAFVDDVRVVHHRAVDPNAVVRFEILDPPARRIGGQASMLTRDVLLREADRIGFLTPDRHGTFTEGKDRGRALVIFNDEAKTHPA